MRAIRSGIILALVGLSVALRCHAAPEVAPPDPGLVRKMWSPYFKPLPKDAPKREVSAEIIDLGRHLFFERALSPDRNRSCNDCHDLEKYGTNGAAAVKAREDGTLKRDVPGLYNLSELKLLRWDGSKTDLRSQIAAALTSPAESAMAGEAAVVERLQSMPRYRNQFQEAFGGDSGEITIKRVVDALAAFQDGLVTRAPFDDFLLGDDEALSAEQLKGAVLFDQKNCSACHTGSAIGGQMIQKAGIMKPWPNQKDLGYFEVSGEEAHKMGFRVPPLRNVAETAPYFHDYSARSLRRAVRDIALHEQGILLRFEEIAALESFLKSFSGKLPTEYIRNPVAGDAEKPISPE